MQHSCGFITHAFASYSANDKGTRLRNRAISSLSIPTIALRSYDWTIHANTVLQNNFCDVIEYRMNPVDPAPDMLSLCQLQSTVSLIRNPLAMGLLTGKHHQNPTAIGSDNIRSEQLDWIPYYQNGQINLDIALRLDVVREIITSFGHTAAQGALLWLWR